VTSRKALGKGLGALIGEGKPALSRGGAAAGESRLREIPLDLIAVNRRQPRRSFAKDELEELAASIRALGVVQPVVVRPLQPAAPEAAGAASPDPASPGALPDPSGAPPGQPAPSAHFELIAGERRLRAARLAGLDHIPALVRPADEVASLEIALAENVAREDLNSIE
jgi:ParB family transcriptional regulator, chromosome partitioning protein